MLLKYPQGQRGVTDQWDWGPLKGVLVTLCAVVDEEDPP